MQFWDEKWITLTVEVACPERLMGVVGGVRNFVVLACVLSAELLRFESFPRVMVLGGVANVGCDRRPGAGCAV